MAWWGFSRCQAMMRARRFWPASAAIDGSTELKYFLSSKSTLSHGGVAEQTGEAAGPASGGVHRGIGPTGYAEYLGELQVPVEEGVLGL
jgi:hypothetical protein